MIFKDLNMKRCAMISAAALIAGYIVGAAAPLTGWTQTEQAVIWIEP